MGWIFDRSVHGQGIAFEACSAALDWAEREIAAGSYPAIIDLENTPSMKLAERLGFVRQGDASYRDAPIALFRRPGRLPTATAASTPTAA
jgi:RimJ/RimL family protein N-acetyltransferase